MKFLLFLLLILSNLSFAMVPQVVENHEQLFIRQKEDIWCWAAMAEGMTSFYFKEKTSQGIIALNNTHQDKYSTPYRVYTIRPERIINPFIKDYLLDDVLSKEGYLAKINYFNNKKVLSLLKEGNPVMLAKDFHVVVIFGYTEIGGETFYNIYDPAAYFTYSPETKIVNKNELEPLFSSVALMLYLDKKANSQLTSI